MPFDPRTLIANLPPFDPGTGSDFDGYRQYCQFYGLEFNDLADQQLGQLRIDGEQVAIHLFQPRLPQGTLLIVHGYLDHHGLYRHLIRYGLERQLNVVCFDLPGHGLSSGKRASIDSFEHYHQLLLVMLQQVERWQLTRPLHLLGQSTGGAIINHYLLSQRPTFEGHIILLAPLVRAANWWFVSTAHWLLRPWKAEVPRQFKANTQDPEFNRFLASDPLQSRTITTAWVGAMKRWLPEFRSLPAADYQPLLIQGDRDATVDWRYNLGILEQKFPQLQRLTISNARHQLANEAEPIRRHYLDWLDQQLR